MDSQRRLNLSVSESRSADGIHRELLLAADGERNRTLVSYDILDPAAGEVLVLDGFVQAVLLHAMKRALGIRIHGNLSRTAWRNLHEFQRAWARWRPGLYHHVDLLPDAVVDLAPRSDRAMQAFSGGVDATFTLLSNRLLNRDRGGHAIEAAVLVQGFDVPLDDHTGFLRLAHRVRTTLSGHGVDLTLVRTNSRSLNLQSWMDSSSLQLAACLHQFSDRYGHALMGSCEPYDALCLPISSNPITDHLLSGDLQRIVHDGAGYSRSEKVEAIAAHPDLVRGLKVCWEGKVVAQNCGHCEKCLRTRLNFAAAGVYNPSCFEAPFDGRMLKQLKARTTIQVAELEGIVRFMRSTGDAPTWLRTLQWRILRARLLIPIVRITRWREFRSWLGTQWRRYREVPAADTVARSPLP